MYQNFDLSFEPCALGNRIHNPKSNLFLEGPGREAGVRIRAPIMLWDPDP